MMVKQSPIPDDFLNLIATKFRMLGDPTRLAILETLMTGGELNVGQVQGSFVLYCLDDPVVEKMCELVCNSLRQEIELQVKRWS